MDNITHTLVGAALAEAGLKKRTALGAATLMIGANFPDLDVAAAPFAISLAIRRGATHGVLALAILPFVLAGIMWLWDSRVRRRRDPTLPPADFRQLAILSAIAIATHPTLDFMNTYGMRWLMPFVDRWFYADVLFIIDPWVLLALAVGVMWSRRSASTRPARLALRAVAAYAVIMVAITSNGRARVESTLSPARFMVEPTPFRPWERGILVEDATAYRFGRWSLFGDVIMDGESIVKGDSDPAVALAKQTMTARRFLKWSRFPFYRVVQEGGATVVRIADARYIGDMAKGWAAVEVRLP